MKATVKIRMIAHGPPDHSELLDFHGMFIRQKGEASTGPVMRESPYRSS